MTIKNVAVAGVTGNVGTAVLKALVDSNSFNVTALIRSGSTTKASFPPNVNVVIIDYSTPSSLESALKGQDAVISALNHMYLETHQRALIDAAASAGVKRFIPSEFGSNLLNPKTAVLPTFAHKKEAEKHLEELAKEGKISYTYVINGAFLDWGLEAGFLGLDLKKKEFKYLDGGESRFSATTLASIGKAVAGVLIKEEETKNRAVYVHDAVVNQNLLFKLAKKVVGEDGWTVIDGGKTEDIEKQSYERLGKGDFSPDVFIDFILRAMHGEGYGAESKEPDNKLLGITEWKEGDIEELIKEIVKKERV